MTRPDKTPLDALERRIYDLIYAYPGRIDEMETRSEDACRELARLIARDVRGAS